METIYNLRIFIIIAIVLIGGYMVGRKPSNQLRWLEYAIILIGAMLVYVIFNMSPP